MDDRGRRTGRHRGRPPDAREIDLAGKTVYPGLIDPYVTLSRLSGKKESRRTT